MSEKKVRLQYLKPEDKSDLQQTTTEIMLFRNMIMKWKTQIKYKYLCTTVVPAVLPLPRDVPSTIVQQAALVRTCVCIYTNTHIPPAQVLAV